MSEDKTSTRQQWANIMKKKKMFLLKVEGNESARHDETVHAIPYVPEVSSWMKHKAQVKNLEKKKRERASENQSLPTTSK